jgi:hypothetical protein
LPLLGHPESGLAALFDESKVKTVGAIKRELELAQENWTEG